MASVPQPVFSLFCKTYAGDLKRIVRLVDSLARHNREALPVVISTPARDQAVFRDALGDGPVQWVCDEDIIAAQPRGDGGRYASWDGRLSQQVIKSEAWRLGGFDTYLCLDSDSVFIRDFGLADFICPMSGTPYTVIHQAKELRQLAENRGIHKVEANFVRESAAMKTLFGRVGPDYDFSPTPVIWSARVWQDLAEQWLSPRGMDFWDAIAQFPSELRWYGEALLAYRSIDLLPIEPLFRVYHYDWHYAILSAQGETPATLTANYLGMVLQSNWDFEMDDGDQARRKNLASRLARRLRRALTRFR